MNYKDRAQKIFYSEVVERERQAGLFVSIWHNLLPENFKILSYCSPLSFRDNDGYSDIWHPWFIKQSFFRQLFFHLSYIPKAIVRGTILFFSGSYGSFFLIDRGENTSLGLAPFYLCNEVSKKRVRTNYFTDEDCDESSWVLFDESGHNSHFGRWGYLQGFFCLVLYLFSTFLKKPRSVSWTSWSVFSLTALVWVVSGYWSSNYSLHLFIEDVLKKKKYKLVFCIHELHQHSRILWALAFKYSLDSISVSHALLSREKLWLHPTSFELENGFKLPQKFIVNSDFDVAHTFETYGNRTEFIKALSPRYSHWRLSLNEVNDASSSKTVLFAGSLAWWDNEILLNAIKKLIKSPSDFRIKLRFHPSSQYRKSWDKWLEKNSDIILIDKDTLKSSIKNCCLVVGVGTTVLEEAPFFNRPSLMLRDESFQTFFKNKIPFQIDIKDLHWGEIEGIIKDYPRLATQKKEMAKEAFGLNQKIFSLSRNEFL